MKSGPVTREKSGDPRHGQAGRPRRYRRFAVDARIAIFRAGQSRPYQGRTLGLSEAGISILLAADLEVGEAISLEFALPARPQTLAVRAVVRNRTGARYGLEFLTLSEQQRTAITSFCQSQDE